MVFASSGLWCRVKANEPTWRRPFRGTATKGNMKINASNQQIQPLQPLHLFLMAMLLVNVVGCTTTGYKRSDAAARSLDAAAVQVQVQRQALGATMESLQDLVKQPAADLKPQFARFSGALD